MNAASLMRQLRRRGWLPRIMKADSRTSRQIEDELDEEFTFHLEQRMRQLQSEGVDAAHARELALASFGDFNQIKQQCRRIALKELTMLKRIHLAVTIILLLALVATALLAFQMYRTAAQQREMAVIMRMEAEQARQRADKAAADAAEVDALLASLLAEVDPQTNRNLRVEALMQMEAMLSQLADQPELQARIRAALEEERRRLEAAPQ